MTHQDSEGNILINNNRGIGGINNTSVDVGEETYNVSGVIEGIEMNRTQNEGSQDRKKKTDLEASEKWKSNLRFIKRTVIFESFHLIDKPVSFWFMIFVCCFNTLLTTITLFSYIFTYEIQFTLNMLFIIIILFLSTILYVLSICLILSIITNRSIKTYLNMALTTTTHFPIVVLWSLLLPEFGLLTILLFQTIVFLYIFSHFTRFAVRRNLQYLILKTLIVTLPIVFYYNGIFILIENVIIPDTTFDMDLFRLLNLFTKKHS